MPPTNLALQRTPHLAPLPGDGMESQVMEDANPHTPPARGNSRPAALPTAEPPVEGRTFAIWLALGLVPSVAIVTLGILFWRVTDFDHDGPKASRPWPETAIGLLLLLQLAHAFLGVVTLEGKRWQAFGVGLLAVPVVAWIALICSMAVTGVWL